MCILIMSIGILVIMMVTNTVIIASNPENVEITSVVKFSSGSSDQPEGGGSPFFGNKSKEPWYIDVYRDYLVVYPGGEIVQSGDLEREGNALSRILNRVESRRDREYVVMMLRPGAAQFSRRIKKLIKSRDIDVGQELYEADRALDYKPANERLADAAGNVPGAAAPASPDSPAGGEAPAAPAPEATPAAAPSPTS